MPELVARGLVPVVVTRSAESASGMPDVPLVIADPVVEGSLEAAFAAHPITATISLLSSRRPNDPEECRRVDYDAVTNAARTSAAHGVRRFLHVSDYGVYRPELLPQIYKLQVEGELLGGHFGALPWTVVRPTAYFPYLSVNFGSVKNGEPYRIFDHGEYAICNPIAREDLAEFLVNALLDEDAAGRILPVGGPWTADNVVSIKSAGDLMFEVLGRTPEFKVDTLDSWDRTVTRMRRAGRRLPQDAQRRVLPRGGALLVDRDARGTAVRRAHAARVLRAAQGPRLPGGIVPRPDEGGDVAHPDRRLRPRGSRRRPGERSGLPGTGRRPDAVLVGQ